MQDTYISARHIIDGSRAIDLLEEDIKLVVGALLSHVTNDELLHVDPEGDGLVFLSEEPSANWQLIPGPDAVKGNYSPAVLCYRGATKVYMFRKSKGHWFDIEHVTEVHAALSVLVAGMIKKVPSLEKKLAYLRTAAIYSTQR